MRVTEKLAAFAMTAFLGAAIMLAPSQSEAASELTEDEVKLVQESWTIIQPRIPTVVDRFYRRYFQMDPAAKALFDDKTMRVQMDAFANILNDVAAGADELSQFEGRMKRLGKLHETLGAEPHQFALFGVAFVDTLRLELKADFKPRARTAWNKIFYQMTRMMEAGYAG